MLSFRVILSYSSCVIAVMAIQGCSGSPASNPGQPADRSVGAQIGVEQAVPNNLNQTGQPRPPDVDENPPSLPIKSVECPKLDSNLYRITLAADPESDARQAGMHLEGELIRVVIEVADPDATLPEDLGILIERRQGPLIRALVPLSQRCRLSENDVVNFIRPPYAGVGN